jgi:hypothetical protein
MRARWRTGRGAGGASIAALTATAIALFAGTAGAAPREAPELARAARLEVRTSPDSLTVGDHWMVELAVEAPAGCTVRFPQALPAGTSADLIAYTTPTAPEQSADAGSTRRRWVGRYELALFDVGDVTLPPLRVEVVADSLRATVSTDSLRTFVTSVLDDSLAAGGLRDLKPQARLAASRWPWIVAAAVLAAAIAAFVWWRRWLRGRGARGDDRGDPVRPRAARVRARPCPGIPRPVGAGRSHQVRQARADDRGVRAGAGADTRFRHGDGDTPARRRVAGR